MSSDAAKDKEFKSDEISCYAISKSGKDKCVKSGKDGEKDPKKDQSFQLEVEAPAGRSRLTSRLTRAAIRSANRSTHWRVKNSRSPN